MGYNGRNLPPRPADLDLHRTLFYRKTAYLDAQHLIHAQVANNIANLHDFLRFKRDRSKSLLSNGTAPQRKEHNMKRTQQHQFEVNRLMLVPPYGVENYALVCCMVLNYGITLDQALAVASLESANMTIDAVYESLCN